ncbi:MAG: DNA mismatch repair endonuclease MutL [Deferrisomatales bacterium]
MGQGRVRVLPDDLANRIAAGEVVERPASVVKELVENAVDAACSRVRIELEEAGRRRLSVEDDGEGMGREDALLSLRRHATSKISSATDLEAIGTLGFRGEALPSIASVSRLRLLTRAVEDEEGTEVRVDGGAQGVVRAAGAPRGTTVEVSDLFYNVPARRKFLKSDATELRSVVDTVTQLALVHHGVGFELRSDGRVLLALPGGQPAEDRVAQVLGGEARGGLHWWRAEAGGWRFALAFAAPHEGRGQRRSVRLFVNGRPVQDRLLFKAVLEGYRGLLEPGRFPLVLLWLQLPADEVDVNVHPAKREVRFRDEGRVFRWVAGRTAEALAGAPWVGGPRTRAEDPPESPGFVTRPGAERVAEALAAYAGSNPRPEGPCRSWAGGGGAGRCPPGLASPRAGRAEPPLALHRGPPGGAVSGGRFGRLRYLGAFDATYLLFEDGDARELVLLDQHAAHERILYEAVIERESTGSGRRQALLFPVTFACSAVELAAFGERAADLEALGFRVETFGPTALAVAEVPAGFPEAAAEAAVRALLAAEDGDEEESSLSQRREGAARRVACAGAVKARRALVASEVEELLSRLDGLRHPGHCPHGRPLMIRLARTEVASMFHRR